MQPGGINYAGSRLVAFRKPEQPAKTEMIELTHFPRQTVDRSRLTAKQRDDLRKLKLAAGAQSSQAQEELNEEVGLSDVDDDLLNEEEKKTKAEAKALKKQQENPEEPAKIKFKSCKLDMSQVFPELMCPFGQTNEDKYNQACKMGKIGKNGEFDAK